MAKEKYSDWELGPFSEWHRNNLCDWYAWTDVDYIGWQNGGADIYIILEVKCLPQSQFEPFCPSDPPDKEQMRVYYKLAQQLEVPAFVVWHTNNCRRFKIDPIKQQDGKEPDYQKSERIEIEGRQEFQDWLDRHRLKEWMEV